MSILYLMVVLFLCKIDGNLEVEKSILNNFKNSKPSYFKKIGGQIFIINDEANYLLNYRISINLLKK